MPDPTLKSELPASFHFSQSSLQDYSECPRRFQLRYLERLAWPAIEVEPVLESERRQRAGQQFHRMVQQHLIGLPVERLNRLPDTPELTRWWGNYLEAKPDSSGLGDLTGLSVELTLSAPVHTYHLLAKYDLIVISPDGKAIIYDWKTSRKRPREEWLKSRLQTRVYQAMLVKAGAYLNKGNPIEPEQVEMVYWFAEYPQEPARFSYSSAQYQRDWELLNGMIAEIDHCRDFPTGQVGKRCDYCCYRSYCDRGEKAGLSDDVDENVDETGTGFNIDFEQIPEIEF